MERLRQLESTEKQLVSSITCLGHAFQELSKEKPALKMFETHSSNFITTLQTVEVALERQINYLSQVSTGQPHEGSSYASQKQLDMARHRLEHSRSRLKELERIRLHHLNELKELQQAQTNQAGPVDQKGEQ